MHEAEWGILLVLSAALCLMAVPVGNWIVQPITQAARQARSANQFHLTDLVVLLVLFQLGLAIPMALVEERSHPSVLTFIGIVWLFALVIWWSGTRRLTLASVRCPWRRATFILFILPVSTLGTMSLVLINLTLLFTGLWVLLLVVNPIGIGAICSCRHLTQWVMR